jgi:hypothetical protein
MSPRRHHLRAIDPGGRGKDPAVVGIDRGHDSMRKDVHIDKGVRGHRHIAAASSDQQRLSSCAERIVRVEPDFEAAFAAPVCSLHLQWPVFQAAEHGGAQIIAVAVAVAVDAGVMYVSIGDGDPPNLLEIGRRASFFWEFLHLVDGGHGLKGNHLHAQYNGVGKRDDLGVLALFGLLLREVDAEQHRC